jgi:prolyl-tRNA synthetase
MTQYCALPVIMGAKSPGERFAGAVETHCLEAMMQDGKAVQAGTSHYLGTNFAKASGIQYTNEKNETQDVHTTSWGVSTRLIGTIIMAHSDDDGLRVPPRIAPWHVVVIPSGHKETDKRDEYINRIESLFKNVVYEGRPVSVKVDRRDMAPPGKGWDWIKQGAPIRLEVGAREAAAGTVTLRRRDQNYRESLEMPVDQLVPTVLYTLDGIQKNYLAQATKFRDDHIRTDITTLEKIREFFSDPANIGFVRAKWCEDPSTEELLKDLKVTIRCIPVDQRGTEGRCVLTGKRAKTDVIFGRSY